MLDLQDDRAGERDVAANAVAPLADWSDDRWHNEIRDAAHVTRQVCIRSKDRIQRYGNGFRADWPEHPDDINNYPFKFISTFTSLLASGAPRFRTQSYRGPAIEPVAEAIKEGLNAWCVQSGYADMLPDVVWDVGFDFGVICLCAEDMPDPEGAELLRSMGMVADDHAATVKPYRVLPNRYVQDPKASHPDEVEWAGHFQVYSIDDAAEMLRGYGADERTIADLPLIGPGSAREYRDEISAYTGEAVNTDEVVILHAWRRRTKRMYFFAMSSKEDYSPRNLIPGGVAYDGPENGPYVVFGVKWIRGHALPYPPLAPTDKLIDEDNAHRGQARDSARAAKRVVRFDNPEDAGAFASAPNNSAVVIKSDGEKNGEVIETKGLTDENLKASEWLQGELDALTGLSAAAQGTLGESSNATEVAVSSSMQQMRTQADQRAFRARQAELARRVAWYMLNTPTMRQYVKSADPKTGRMRERMVVGGEPENGVDVRDLGIDVIPYTSEYVNEQQQRENTMLMVQNLQNLLAMNAQYPAGVNYAALWQRMTDTMNYGDGANDLIHWDVLAQQAAMMGMMGGGAMGQMQVPAQEPAEDVTQKVRKGAARLGAANR